MDAMTAREKYEAFIIGIDSSVAGRDENGQSLADRVAGSAEQNADDTMVDRGDAGYRPDYYEIALNTAKFMLDDWRNNYPELRRE